MGAGRYAGPARAPGLKGSVDLFGHAFPAYDLFLIAVGPAVMAGLWLLLKETPASASWSAPPAPTVRCWPRWVSIKHGCSPRLRPGGHCWPGWAARWNCPGRTIHPAMGTPVVVSAFVVVVVGGLGSLPLVQLV